MADSAISSQAPPASPKAGDLIPRNNSDWKLKMATALSASQQLTSGQVSYAIKVE